MNISHFIFRQYFEESYCTEHSIKIWKQFHDMLYKPEVICKGYHMRNAHAEENILLKCNKPKA